MSELRKLIRSVKFTIFADCNDCGRIVPTGTPSDRTTQELEQIAQSYADKQSERNWISVEDRLPEMVKNKNIDNWQESLPCAVLIKNKTHEIGFLNGNIEDNGEGMYQTWFCPQTDDIILGVTHWFPLPLNL